MGITEAKIVDELKRASTAAKSTRQGISPSGLPSQVPSGYISGEELARSAGVSRAAIWKHIKNLREKGYEIEAAPRRGYRLVSSPNALIPEEILPLLKTRYLGRNMVYRAAIDSTNAFARELAEHGAVEGTVVIAEEQIQGRGRLERAWASPAGGIWMSVILRPQLLPAEASRFTLLAAVAVAKSLEGLGVAPQIKWPNDVLLDDKKVCGILLELTAQPEKIKYLIIGLGINANFEAERLPENSRARATTLYDFLGKEVERPVLVAALLCELEREYDRLTKGNWSEIVADWMARSNMLGRQIALETMHGVVEGEFVGVDELGAVRIRLAGGAVKTFAAGDVTVKKDR